MANREKPRSQIGVTHAARNSRATGGGAVNACTPCMVCVVCGARDRRAKRKQQRAATVAARPIIFFARLFRVVAVLNDITLLE